VCFEKLFGVMWSVHLLFALAAARTVNVQEQTVNEEEPQTRLQHAPPQLLTLLGGVPGDAFQVPRTVPSRSVRRPVVASAPRDTTAVAPRLAPLAAADAHAPARADVRMDFGFQRPIKEDAEAGEVADVPFEVRFSIGNVVSVTGGLFFAYSILSFLLNNGESDFVGTLGFVYSIPALVGGLALKYAELPPVPVTTTPAAEALREQKGTSIQKKIYSDATRFTYGDAHMEDPLRSLKLAPRGMGPPELKKFSEEVTEDGQYALGMTFFAPNTPYRVWKDRAPRYSRFFGPGVRAKLQKVNSAKRLVKLTLITTDPGDDDTPLELDDKGEWVPVKTAQEEEAAKAAALDDGFD